MGPRKNNLSKFAKPEALITKYETNENDQIMNVQNLRMSENRGETNSNILILDLFRISDFGFSGCRIVQVIFTQALRARAYLTACRALLGLPP
jgi:hypothetical protein